MNRYILDIETKQDKSLQKVFFENIKPNSRLKDPEKIKQDIEDKKSEAKRKMMVDPDYADILCVGVKVIGEKPQLFNMKQFTEWLNTPISSKDVAGHHGYVGTNASKQPITFNGANFDIPLLLKCAIKQNIESFPYSRFKKMMGRFQKDQIDLMNELSMVWGQNKSLDHYLQIYLGISKTPIDFETATAKEVREHCKEDLINTEKLYLLLKDKLFI